MPILNVKSNYERQGEADGALLPLIGGIIIDVEYDVTKTYLNITMNDGYMLRVRAHGCYEFSVRVDKGDDNV